MSSRARSARVQLCAHRGDSSRYRENTLPAIRSAISAGAEFVEIDVRITADGAAIVVHDPTLERLWGLSAAVAEATLGEIRALGTADARPPLLAEVLELFNGAVSTLLIDVSEPAAAEPIFRVVEKSATPVVWCGDGGAMRTIRRLDPAGRIWMAWDESIVPSAADLADLAPEAINVPYPAVTREQIETIHALGCAVTVYTVDDDAAMRRARTIGVDTVTTNQLGRLQRIAAKG